MRDFLDRFSIRQIVTVAIATPVLALFAAVFAIGGWPAVKDLVLVIQTNRYGVGTGYTRRHGRIECIVLFVIERMRLSIGKYGKMVVLQGHTARTAA